MPKKKTWFAFGLTVLMGFLLYQNPPLRSEANDLLARLTIAQIAEAERLAAEQLKAHKIS